MTTRTFPAVDIGPLLPDGDVGATRGPPRGTGPSPAGPRTRGVVGAGHLHNIPAPGPDASRAARRLPHIEVTRAGPYNSAPTGRGPRGSGPRRERPEGRPADD